ncbi:four-jointed box protein 1 [Brachyhypopomus gauderio]|uniref:four-jointed box protein 1 n=1 Tax=Brachyhypopomus gauderio TaxID=698409 RepID=UPI004042176C
MRTKVNLSAGLLLCAVACVLSPKVNWTGSFLSVTGQTPGGNRAPRLLPVSAMHIINVHNRTTNGPSVGETGEKTFSKSSTVGSDRVMAHKIIWGAWLENLLSPVFDEKRSLSWREKVQGAQVVFLEAGCGRLTNRIATFADGTKACVRYGIDADQVLGETLSYYLATLLGISNLPPLALSKLDLSSHQWATVRESIGTLHWTPNAIVSLTQWIPGVTGVSIPPHFRKETGNGVYLSHTFQNATLNDLRELMQWTDLVLFDYLTANFDRIVSHVFSLQWDARAMDRATNNLLKSTDGDLIFIDNEAGLVHGYRVLDRWERFHKTLLNSICIFREQTVHRVTQLKLSGNAANRLFEIYHAREPYALELGFLSESQMAILQTRVDTLYRHFRQCSALT